MALLDADDLFLPGKLSRVAQAFQQNPSLGMVYHTYMQWNVQADERRDSDFLLVSGDIHTSPEQFFFYVPHPTSCISFRRTSLGPLLPIPESIQMLADAYPVDLIPFVAPILAIPESLTVYRIHGANHYFTDEQQMPLEIRKSRLQKQQILFRAMREWLAHNGYTKKQASVRSFLARWELYQESYEFPLHAPGRLRYFRHLMKYNYRYRSRISWRLQVINYFNAFASLATGYRYFPYLEKWRLRAFDSIRRSTKKDIHDTASRR